MKAIRKTSLLLIAIFSLAIVNAIDPLESSDSKLINSDKSEISWLGEKVTGEHVGSINIKEGQVEITKGILEGGNFIIDMSSITSKDLDGEYKDKLEGHLKSDDFFGVDKYPTATLQITKVVKKNSSGNYLIKADLTIKGITNQVEFEAQTVENNNIYTINATIVIDRSKYNVRYGSGSFFDNLGDKTIYDNFTLTVKLVTE